MDVMLFLRLAIADRKVAKTFLQAKFKLLMRENVVIVTWITRLFI